MWRWYIHVGCNSVTSRKRWAVLAKQWSDPSHIEQFGPLRTLDDFFSNDTYTLTRSFNIFQALKHPVFLWDQSVKAQRKWFGGLVTWISMNISLGTSIIWVQTKRQLMIGHFVQPLGIARCRILPKLWSLSTSWFVTWHWSINWSTLYKRNHVISTKTTVAKHLPHHWSPTLDIFHQAILRHANEAASHDGFVLLLQGPWWWCISDSPTDHSFISWGQSSLTLSNIIIRPHRFGGEGVLIGVQFGYTKCSSHICLYSSRYISFSWGGHLKFSHRNPSSAGVFVIFRTIFGRWIWRGYWDGILGRFGGVPATEKRTWEASGNGKTDNNENKTANTDVFKGFGMLEHWTHCKNQCFGPTLYWRTRKLCCFWRKDWNNTVRTCVLDRLYAQKCINYVGVEGKQSKKTANICLKHVQYLYKDWTKKLAVWAAPHAKRGELYENFHNFLGQVNMVFVCWSEHIHSIFFFGISCRHWTTVKNQS